MLSLVSSPQFDRLCCLLISAADPSIPISEHLADKVTALWRLPYEDQLKKKNRQMVWTLNTHFLISSSVNLLSKSARNCLSTWALLGMVANEYRLSAVPQWVRDALKENSGATIEETCAAQELFSQVYHVNSKASLLRP